MDPGGEVVQSALVDNVERLLKAAIEDVRVDPDYAVPESAASVRPTSLRCRCCEDNENNLYMRQLWFDVLGGYEILSARDGAAGIAMAATEQPYLILMDLNLPEFDGWEATRRLKADPATCDIPIIALSAHAMPGDREKALAAGCNDFDTKPIEFDRLLGKIQQALATQPPPNPSPVRPRTRGGIGRGP